MTATAHRRRLARSDLRVVSASGINAAFTAELRAEQLAQTGHQASWRSRSRGWPGSWWYGIRAIFCRSRRNGRYRLRTSVVVGLLCGVTLSAYLLNVDGALEPQNQVVGSSATASAGCPFIPLPDTVPLPFADDIDLRPFKQSLNNFCDAVGNVASNLADAVTQRIKDGIWSAFHTNRFCFGSRVALSPEDPDQGINSLMTRGVGFVFGVDKVETGTTTTWNQYGIAGASWNTYFVDCYDSRNLVNYAANFIFGFAKVLALVAILLFQQTFNNQIVDYFFVPQGDPPAPESAIDSIMKNLNAEIYVEFFAVAVVIGASVLLYNNVLRGVGSTTAKRIHKPDAPGADAQGFIDIPGPYVRGSGLSDAVSKIVIMAAVAAFAVLFVNYGSGFVRDANAYTNEIGAGVLSALAGTDCKDSSGAAVATTPYDCAAQTMYDALIFRTWASGYIGELEVLNNEAETKSRRELAMRMLRQNAYSMAESAEIANPATSAQRRQELIDAKQNDRLAMVKGWGVKFIAKDGEDATRTVNGELVDEFAPDSWRPHNHVQAVQETYWQQWSGGEAGQRIFVAGLALLASFTLGLVIIAIAVAYLVLELMTVVLAMVAPMVFLIGLIPGFGFRLLLRWAETFMQLFIKRIALVCFVGALLAMLHIIFALALVWWMQVVLVIGVAMVGLSYRHQLTSWASAGMTGVGSAAGIATGGVAGLMQARRSIKQAREGWRSSRDLALSERFGVAGRSGYAALDRPYETEDVEYLPAAQGVSRPSRARQPRAQAPQRYQSSSVGAQYRQGSNRRGQSSPYPAPRSPTSGRRGAGYVYRPEGQSGFDDDFSARRNYRRERVTT